MSDNVDFITDLERLRDVQVWHKTTRQSASIRKAVDAYMVIANQLITAGGIWHANRVIQFAHKLTSDGYLVIASNQTQEISKLDIDWQCICMHAAVDGVVDVIHVLRSQKRYEYSDALRAVSMELLESISSKDLRIRQIEKNWLGLEGAA